MVYNFRDMLGRDKHTVCSDLNKALDRATGNCVDPTTLDNVTDCDPATFQGVTNTCRTCINNHNISLTWYFGSVARLFCGCVRDDTFNSNTNLCVDCDDPTYGGVEECDECSFNAGTNQVICSSCTFGFFLDSVSEVCVDCINLDPNCVGCKDNSGDPICTKCEPTHILNATQKACI
jgi:hypothetical protein